MQVTVWDMPADKVVFLVDRLVFPCLIQFRRLLARHCLLRKQQCRCAAHDAEEVRGSDREGGERDPGKGDATLSQGMQPPCGREDRDG